MAARLAARITAEKVITLKKWPLHWGPGGQASAYPRNPDID
ncbi:hypothetical protein NOR51B_268 [Luminiphilus syltensis NOR5-1B]|uniref:Uncharacterized protein n=1 Tax=Luminiphilus syltensis NOR5-1B TaxID=565045 RepID=B8KV67_9GAMM|nr:hypothetical protein NOR51B_268 [Luminiphilus syltensis NOR5-1B]